MSDAQIRERLREALGQLRDAPDSRPTRLAAEHVIAVLRELQRRRDDR